MKRIANFLVNKRFFMLIIMLVMSVISALFIPKVKVIKDRTEYLKEDSRMKMGLNIMEEEFKDVDDKSSIRVMFYDLTPTQIQDVKKRLESIKNVSSVSYDETSEDYNKDNLTLFIVNSKFDYSTKEEEEIENTIKTSFPEFRFEYANNDIQSTEVPTWLILVALALAIVILLIMSNSWLEPILFILTIGMAVLINLGTNIFLVHIDEITMAIGPILQFVLSMDYSIILMNRYRQERDKNGNNIEAMKIALAGSVRSVFSSSFTTMVGLLALVFLSFKLGPELGIVLAKGVFISMICVFTVLPTLILAFDKLLNKTQKRMQQIPTGFFARLSFKIRRAMPLFFVAILITFFILQSYTNITFTEKSDDPLKNVFPKDNTVVVLYKNTDEGKISYVISEIEQDKNVKSALAYSNTLNKELTANDMVEAIDKLKKGKQINENVIRLVYYTNFSGDTPKLTASEFMNFISKEVIPDEVLNQYIDEEILNKKEYFENLSDKELLIKPMTATGMANFLGVSRKKVKQVYLYYTILNGVEDSGKMTLPIFVNFVVNDVANNETYGGMTSSSTLSSLRQLKTFTDKNEILKQRTSLELSNILDIDESLVQTVFILHNAEDMSDKTMTMLEFSTFLSESINGIFSSMFNEETKMQILKMHELIQIAASNQGLTVDEMSQVLSIDIETINNLYFMYYPEDPNANLNTITLANFSNFLVNDVLTNEEYAALFTEEQKNQIQQTNNIIQLSSACAPLNINQLAQAFSVDENMTTVIFRLYYGSDITTKTMSIKEFVDYMLSDPIISSAIDMETKRELIFIQSVMNESINETKFTSRELASFLGMSNSQAEQIYILYLNEYGPAYKIAPREFVSFLVNHVLDNYEFSSHFNEEDKKELVLAHNLIESVIDETRYSVDEMYDLIKDINKDLSKNDIEVLYLLYAGTRPNINYVMTIENFFNYVSEHLINDNRFKDHFDEETKEDLLVSKTKLNDAIKQMKGKDYSRLVLTSTYLDESMETYEYIDKIHDLCKNNLSEYYLIGNSVMVSEMNETFDREYLMISIIMAVAIFFVVLLAFKNPTIPLILTLIVQCGVYITVSAIGAYSGSMYYLALLIVQSILMGATIDYGIVFSNYYVEGRKTMDVEGALHLAYEKSIHTIMTSGVILVLVLALLGIFVSSTMISEVAITLSIGAAVAILLILFVLPAIIACFDRLFNRKRK